MRLVEKIRRKTIFVWKDRCLELWHERSCRKVRWEMLRITKEKVSSLQQVATPCIDDHLIPPEEYETNGKLSAVCAQMVLKCLCLYLARMGRLNLLWSVNTLARSVTTWNMASDQRLLRLINCIDQTKDYTQFCAVAIRSFSQQLDAGLRMDGSTALQF